MRLLEAGRAPDLVPAAPGPPPTLRVAVNADSLATWFPAAAASFGRASGLALDLALDDEGHTAERLRAGEVLAAVTADPAPVQGCRTVARGALRYAACASPAFAARHFPAGVTPAALARAPHLRFDRRDRLQAHWAAAAHGVALAGPTHGSPSTTHACLDLALAGLAWGLQPLPLAAPHLAAGRPVELPPAHRLAVPLHWTATRLPATPLRHLTAAVRAAAKAGLEQ